MKILTAHELKTGEVIYWSNDGAWSASIADAALMENGTADAALRRAEAAETIVVHSYLVPMDGPGSPVARERVREIIRAQGPTVHPHFGKQAERGA